MKVALISVIMTLMQFRSASQAVQSALFHKVLVSRATIMTSQRLESAVIPLNNFQTLRCSTICISLSWSDLWCSDASTGQCLFSNMIVMPGYVGGTSADDVLTCYTRRPRDMATNAVIQATISNYNTPSRVKENLVDGIYDRQTLDSCYTSEKSETNHWFVLDFGVPLTVRSVRLFSQPGGTAYMVTYLANLEARVGMSPVNTPGDFSSYAFFGIYLGPASSFSQEIVIEAQAPMTARFLSVQKVSGTDYTQICHLEIH
ncbi:uncharacterized protein LOC122262858 [Penaeus japonicus]|uniref:uncharacterized protein LOC122262858 n=1 Tax=Penaeus japonicus TaxID=27405 RepID=UPI001C70EA67|nr:uncharacterized protein LOC122262858 [Penaeus japonicus]